MDQELLDLLARLGELNDEELADLEQRLTAAADELLEGDQDDEALQTLEAIADGIDSVRSEQENRTQAAEERSNRAQALAERIRGGDGDDGESTDDASEGNGEGDSTDDAEADSADDDGAGSDADADADEPEAVAASAPRNRVRTPARPARPSPVAARRPRVVQPRQSAPQLSLVAAANVPGITAGEPLNSMGDLGQAFSSAFQATRGYRGPRTKIPVARAVVSFPDDRLLDGNLSENQRKINAVTSQEALVAAGGICAPSGVRYDLPTLGSEARPVRDGAMARFGADRGGIRTLPPPVITDLAGAVDVWTEANDRNPGSDGPATKPCLTVNCPDEDETLVEAITRCLRFGNFRARYFPEQISAWTDLAAVNHARLAENQLLATIGAGSTQVTTGQLLGAMRDVLAALDRIVAAFRSRHRTDVDFPLRFVAPAWLVQMLMTDLARELPGATAERLATARADIERFLANRNVNTTWTLDGEAGQIFGAQGDGPLIGWPSTVVTYLYPEGSWLFLDGGMLDLGLIRDSVLNDTNDFEMFAETFEGAHFHGIESFRLTMDLCPDGATSATVDIDPCTSGS